MPEHEFYERIYEVPPEEKDNRGSRCRECHHYEIEHVHLQKCKHHNCKCRSFIEVIKGNKLIHVFPKGA